MIRVVGTISLMFHPGLLDPVSLTTERANKPSLSLGGSLSSMLSLMVLTHPLGLAYSWPQSRHATQLPCTQAFVCSVHIHLVASTFPHLLHGNFSPRWTPICTIKWWWVLKDFSHTGQSFLSLVTAGIWYRTSVTSLAWAPSGKSSPWRRANTCCLTHFKALFFTTTSSSVRQGSGGTGTGAGPLNLHLATPGMAGRPSVLSSLESPTTPSSSVSLWWSTFHLDIFSVEHSNTDFSNIISALTENVTCQSFS